MPRTAHDLVGNDRPRAGDRDEHSQTFLGSSVDGRMARGALKPRRPVQRNLRQARRPSAIYKMASGFGAFDWGRRGRLRSRQVGYRRSNLPEVNIRLRDVFVGLDAIPGVRQIRVGHFREPYSLDGMTSSNFMTFLERAPSNVIAPARNWGVAGFWWPETERLLSPLDCFETARGVMDRVLATTITGRARLG